MSGNLALVVDQRGAHLELTSRGTVAVTTPDGRRESVGVRALGSVVMYGDVQLSTGLLRALSHHGVAVAMLPLRGGHASAGFLPMAHRHAALRHAQHCVYANAEARLALARMVVGAKLEAMADFADRCKPDAGRSIRPTLAEAMSAPDLASLMGVEGAATVKHFAQLHSVYEAGGPFRFNGRSRRPPLDEPNALMSLTYALTQQVACQLALRAGLDVQLGFLHGLQRERQSLALDLIEPARSTLDGWVHELLCQRQVLSPASFARLPDGGVQLTKHGRAVFYPLWFAHGHAIVLPAIRSLLGRLMRSLRDPGQRTNTPEGRM